MLNNIYTYSGNFTGAGDANAFHAAVDGMGRTVTLILTDLGLIGGYNPQSWNSTVGYVFTVPDSQRTAFIFNLTSGLLQRQILGPASGVHQTFYNAGQGPSFGLGDIWITNSTGQLSKYATQGSYGIAGGLNLFGVSGIGLADYTEFNVLGIETFTIANAVPEPGTMALGGVALLLVAANGQRHRR